MLIEIVIFFLASLLQVTLVPLDLVLIILIARSLAINDKSNFYLAFGFGLALSLMQGLPLASISAVYLILVEIIQMIKRTEFSKYWLSVLPISLVIFTLYSLINLLAFHVSTSVVTVLIEVILCLPCFLAFKLWQEKFTPIKDMRLKMRT